MHSIQYSPPSACCFYPPVYFRLEKPIIEQGRPSERQLFYTSYGVKVQALECRGLAGQLALVVLQSTSRAGCCTRYMWSRLGVNVVMCSLLFSLHGGPWVTQSMAVPGTHTALPALVLKSHLCL